MRRQRVGAYAAYSHHTPQCLHIGAEIFAIPGWFNTDLDPRGEGIYFLDATLPFPFPSDSFDFIFSEHMIEHISLGDGMKMLRECRRILKPGGVIRTATPNLRNILALLSDLDGNEAYLEWAVEQFELPKAPFPKAPSVINHFFRAWGHQFIYDPKMLQTSMEQAGFGEIVQCEIGASRHEPLRGLERHGERWSPWVNKFETMVFEGTATGVQATPAVSAQMAVVG
jgi:predicted SAM-dependent methyltransferase